MDPYQIVGEIGELLLLAVHAPIPGYLNPDYYSFTPVQRKRVIRALVHQSILDSLHVVRDQGVKTNTTMSISRTRVKATIRVFGRLGPFAINVCYELRIGLSDALWGKTCPDREPEPFEHDVHDYVSAWC